MLLIKTNMNRATDFKPFTELKLNYLKGIDKKIRFFYSRPVLSLAIFNDHYLTYEVSSSLIERNIAFKMSIVKHLLYIFRFNNYARLLSNGKKPKRIDSFILHGNLFDCKLWINKLRIEKEVLNSIKSLI
jgi:hypothetical protein